MKPDQSEPVADEISHALSIDGIQTSSDASTVWTIEVSKNDLLSTAPSPGNYYYYYYYYCFFVAVPSPTTTERVRGGKTILIIK